MYLIKLNLQSLTNAYTYINNTHFYDLSVYCIIIIYQNAIVILSTYKCNSEFKYVYLLINLYRVIEIV